MSKDTRNALIAAAIVLVVFGFSAFYLPPIMMALGEASPVVAALFAILFVAAFFVIFWLRGRSQRRRDEAAEKLRR